MQGSFAEAACSWIVRTPAVPAANAKNSAEVRMTFFNMAGLPIQVDHAVFYAVSATRCDSYHFSKTRCDFSHTSGKPSLLFKSRLGRLAFALRPRAFVLLTGLPDSILALSVGIRENLCNDTDATRRKD